MIEKNSYEVPAIFKMMAREGNVEEEMMYNTYNMGIGMMVCVDPADVDKTMEAIKAAGSADPAAVLEALPDVVYTGVCGKVVFLDSGDADRSEAVVKKCNTADGTWEFVATQTVK